jgi:hypothetical protein
MKGKYTKKMKAQLLESDLSRVRGGQSTEAVLDAARPPAPDQSTMAVVN